VEYQKIKDEKITYQKSLVNTKRKKLVSSLIAAYYPIATLTVGNPIPNPMAFIQLSPEVMTLFSIISTCMTISAGFIGVGFYVEKRNNNKLFAQAELHRHEIQRMNDKIDEKTRDILLHIKDLKESLFDALSDKAKTLEDKTIKEVETARNIVDQKFMTLEEKIKYLKERTDRLESMSLTKKDYKGE